ncbi:TPA: DNA translocase FtsK 4TM domain-containing protein, partial [Providencia rettgeri]|nr:DNA translocase FtsK 4TM domain-containing protein [Providencia rettgeri]HBC7429101.1 DNA translocase FtsK 4TM domain-containing protein [Providencia rettgeri]
MSQEYTEDKHIKFKKLSSGRRLLEVILLAICLSALFLMVALLSFSPSDPSWSQTTWNAPVKNLGGSVGSWSADILFSAFGILAFAIPPLLLLGCWAIFQYESQRRYIDFFSLSLRLIGGLALILSSCGLAALNFDDLPNFASGGVIGSVFSSAIMPWFNSLGATLALLFLWAISFTLFTGWSWLTIAEKIGAAVLLPITLLTNRARGDDLDNYDYDVEETEGALQRAQEAEHRANDDLENIDADDILFSAPTVAELVTEIVPTTEKTTNEAITATENSIPLANQSVSEQVPVPTFSAVDEPSTYHFEVPEDYQPKLGAGFDITSDTVNEPLVQASPYVAPEEQLFSVQHHQQTEPQKQGNTAYQEYSDKQKTPVQQAAFEPQTHSAPPLDAANITQSVIPSSVIERGSNPAALAAAGISVAALERHAQVKQNMEPELPRPNPVRLPTRRELYGIRIPSLRDAELQRREEEASKREQIYQQWSASESEQLETDDEAQQGELLRAQFLEQQRERYGEVDETDYEAPLNSVHSDEEPLQNEPMTENKISSFTQPEIEHRWASASQLSNNTHTIPEPEEITPIVDNGYQPQFTQEYSPQVQEDFEPRIDLRKEFSVLDSFTPIDDLVDNEPADPLFMPSFSASSVPPAASQNNIDNIAKGLGNPQSVTQTFA